MKDRLNDLCENISRVKSLFFAYTSSQTNMKDKGIIEEDLIKLFDKIDSQIIRAYRVATLYENTENTLCNALNKIEEMKKDVEELKLSSFDAGMFNAVDEVLIKWKKEK
jgi:hypothetical protein